MEKKQEERIKFLMETFKVLVTLFLALTGGIFIVLRSTYPQRADPNAIAIDRMILTLGMVFDIFLLIAIFVLWFEIRRIVRQL